jgi:hypothetical protein
MPVDYDAVVTNADFITTYPVFGDTTKFPAVTITLYLTTAQLMLPFLRWSSLKPFGSMLWAAHFLVLDAQEARQASTGIPGQPIMPTASKSVGSASVSYDSAGAQELNAGHWNATDYGRRFIRFARMAGMGGIQLN